MNKNDYFERYQKILEMKGCGKTLEEIANVYSVSKQRIFQILVSGVKKLKYSGDKKEQNAGAVRNHYRKMMDFIIESLGGKCASCGITDKRVLQIDHINGGGVKEHREKGSYHFYVGVKKMIESGVAQNKYQLLCANCNWIKRHENNETKRKY